VDKMIDAKWIDYWVSRYLDDSPDYDTEVLEQVDPGVHVQRRLSVPSRW
jgi:hypothetical protein